MGLCANFQNHGGPIWKSCFVDSFQAHEGRGAGTYESATSGSTKAKHSFGHRETYSQSANKRWETSERSRRRESVMKASHAGLGGLGCSMQVVSPGFLDLRL